MKIFSSFYPSTWGSTWGFSKTPQTLANKGFPPLPIPDHPPSSLFRGGGQVWLWCVLWVGLVVCVSVEVWVRVGIDKKEG